MPPFRYSAIPKQEPKRSLLDVVPPEVLNGWGMRLAVLENLTWQYADTIIDLCVQMKIRATRPLVTAIREAKREYDVFRQDKVEDETVTMETKLTVMFEEWCEDDLKKLYHGLCNEIGKLGLTPDYRNLVLATQQALTVMDAARIYARQCDRKIRTEYNFPIHDECMLQKAFMRLYYLLPQFAGDKLQPNLAVRKLTASILADRTSEMELTATYNDKIISI